MPLIAAKFSMKWTLAALCVLTAASAGSAVGADAGHPVVIELFQSQGCSSCPPANANVIALSTRPDVLALSFQVTYWDHLGWKDTYSKPQFTARQWDYARAMRHHMVFTPQVVINGRADGVGVDRRELDALVQANANRTVAGPAVSFADGTVSVGAGQPPIRGADVWLVRYDPRIVQVAIARGENGGKTLPHKNVVRELIHLGLWTGEPQSFRMPPATDPAFSAAVLVQTVGAGPILAAAKS